MIPQDAPHEDAQTATEATGDAETSAGTEGGRDDPRAMRDRIASAIADEAKRRTIPPAWPAGPGGSGATMQEVADAVMAVVQPELDRLTERIPYREGETEEDYLDRQVARWRSEAWQARGKLKAAEVERDQLKAALGPVPLPDEPCGSTEPADGRLTCTLPARHDVHYAAGSGTAWRCLCIPTDAEAAVARVRTALADIKTAIDTEMSDDESGLVRSYEILTAALDQGHDDLPAVREFAADFDPRGEAR